MNLTMIFERMGNKMKDDLISRKAALELLGEPHPLDHNAIADVQKIIALPAVEAVPLDKLCELLAEMYHCPSSGWPSSGCACHPGCPDEAFEKLCGTDCDKHTDVERWKAFLTSWMEELKNDAE